jgi:two-component system cell cycle response regulator DivK
MTGVVVVASAHPEPQRTPGRPQPRAHRLPSQDQASPRPQHQARPVRRARGIALVLVVDDSLDVRQMYSEYLSYRGFSVLTAADGPRGIELALAARPDVIVMDLAMPNMTGTTATQRLKNHPRTRNIPVVILTGHPFNAIEQRALEAGAAKLLTKPCLPEDLEEHLRAVLEWPAGLS